MENRLRQIPIPPYPGERDPGKESIVKVAAIQTEPRIGDKKRNVMEMIAMIEKAAGQGVTLMVTPELSNTGYIFNSREEAFSMSEEVPHGPTTDEWLKVANKHNIYIVGGIAEREGDCLYDSAALVGPKGHIGTYRIFAFNIIFSAC